MSEKKTPAPTFKERFGKLYKDYIRPIADQVVNLAVPVVVGAVLKSYKDQAPGADKWYGKLAWTIGTFAVGAYVTQKVRLNFLENLDEGVAEFENVIDQLEEAKKEIQEEKKAREEFQKQIDDSLELIDQIEEAKKEIQEGNTARKEFPDMDEFRKRIDAPYLEMTYDQYAEHFTQEFLDRIEDKKFDKLVNESISVDDYEWLSKISQETLDGISEDKKKDDSE